MHQVYFQKKKPSIWEIWRKRFRTAGVLLMICALIFVMLPSVVYAEEDNTWLSYFEYERRSSYLYPDSDMPAVILTAYKGTEDIDSLVIPETVTIGKTTYRVCLGNGSVFSRANIATITSLDLSHVETSRTTSFSSMFLGYTVTHLNVDNFNTSNVTDMRFSFHNMPNMVSLDLHHFDTSNVTSMHQMFGGCRNLEVLNIQGFETSNVTDMSYMFANCSSLQSIDLSSFVIREDTTTTDMFYDNRALQTVITPKNVPAEKDISLGSTFYDINTAEMYYYLPEEKSTSLTLIKGYPVLAESVTVDPTSASIHVGEDVQLAANVLPDNTSNKAVKWSSEDESIASVDENGLVTGNGVGQVKITVTTESGASGGYSAECIIDVLPVSVTGISVNPTEIELEVGEDYVPTITVLPDNATDKSVSFVSDSPEIASVDAVGTITGVSEGTTSVHVTTNDGSFSAGIQVTVKPRIIMPESLALNLHGEELILGESAPCQLIATILPENTTNKDVTWESTDENIVTVDNNGLVRPVGVGTATVTATSVAEPLLSDNCIFTVESPDVSVSDLTLDKHQIRLKVGGSTDLTAIISPEDATNPAVTWSKDSDTIALVIENTPTASQGTNEHVVTIKALEIGTMTITATAEDTGIRKECEVTVIPADTPVIPVTDITLDKYAITLGIGESTTLTATVIPEDATNTAVRWQRSAGNVATVARRTPTATQGNNVHIVLITAQEVGTMRVRAIAEDGELSMDCIVTVKEPDVLATDFRLDKHAITMEIGGEETIHGVFTPSNTTNQRVTFDTDSLSVAFVDAHGRITAVSEGTATITGTTEDGLFSDQCIVTVKKKEETPDPVPPKTPEISVDDKRKKAPDLESSFAAVSRLGEDLTLVIEETEGTRILPVMSRKPSDDDVYYFSLKMLRENGEEATGYGTCSVSFSLPDDMVEASGESLTLYYLNGSRVETVSFTTSPTVRTAGVRTQGGNTLSMQFPGIMKYAMESMAVSSINTVLLNSKIVFDIEPYSLKAADTRFISFSAPLMTEYALVRTATDNAPNNSDSSASNNSNSSASQASNSSSGQSSSAASNTSATSNSSNAGSNSSSSNAGQSSSRANSASSSSGRSSSATQYIPVSSSIGTSSNSASNASANSNRAASATSGTSTSRTSNETGSSSSEESSGRRSSNAMDMPQTGARDMTLYLLALMLFLMGCICIVLSFPSREKEMQTFLRRFIDVMVEE